MKKLFTLLFLATSMICFGQNKNFLKEVEVSISMEWTIQRLKYLAQQKPRHNLK